MVVDSKKPIDEDHLTLELGELLSSVPDIVTSEDLVSEEERVRQAEEQKQSEDSERDRQRDERKQRGIARDKKNAELVASDVPVSAEDEVAKAQKLLDSAPEVPISEVSVIMEKAVLVPTYRYGNAEVEEKVESAELPPLPEYVKVASSIAAKNDKMPMVAFYRAVRLIPIPGTKARVDRLQVLHKERLDYLKGRFSQKYYENKTKIGVMVLFFLGLLMASMVHSTFALLEIQNNRDDILAKFSKAIGREVSVSGKLDFIPFPPHFLIEGVTIKNPEGAGEGNFIVVDKVKLSPAFFPLIFGQLTLAGVELVGSTMYIENFDDMEPNWQIDFTSSKGNETQFADFTENHVDIDKVSYTAGKIVIRSGDREYPSEKIFHIPSSSISAGSLNGPYNVSGELEFREINSVFNYEFSLGEMEKGEKVDFSFELEGDGLTAVYEGNASAEAKGNVFEGKFEANIEKAQVGLKNYFAELGTLSNRFMGSLLEAKDTKVIADIRLDSSRLKIANVKMTSEFIDANLGVDVVFGDIKNIAIDLKINNINLDAGAQAANTTFNLITLPRLKKELSETLSYDIKFAAKKVQFNENEYHSIILDASAKKSKIDVRELNIEGIPGKGRIWLSGESHIDKEGEYFLGDFSLYGESLKEIFTWFEVENKLLNIDALEEFSFRSNLLMMGDVTSFKNYKFKNGDTVLNGTIDVIQPNSKPTASVTIHSKTFSIDKYFDTTREEWKPVDERDLNEQYAFFDWLRRVRRLFSGVNAKIHFDDVTFRNNHLNYFFVDLDYGGSKIDLKELSFLTDSGKISFSAQLNNASLVPQIDIAAKADVIDIAEIKKILGILDTDVEKERIKQNSYWSQFGFDFTMFNVFVGKLDVTADIFRHNRYKLTEFVFRALNKDKYIDVKDLRGDMQGGSVKVTGRIDTATRPVVSFSGSLRNIDMRGFLDVALGDKAGKNISGRFSSSMTGKMDGYSVSEWVRNLSGRAQVITRGVNMKGADLLSIQKKVPFLKSSQAARYWIRKYLSGGYIVMNYISAIIDFNGGIGKFTRIPIQAKLMRKAQMSGLINLTKWQVDARMKFALRSRKGMLPLYTTLIGNLSSPVQEWSEKELFKTWQDIFFKSQR